MTGWVNKSVYRDKANSLLITVADVNTKDLYRARTMKNKTGGVQFLSRGSLKFYNSDMEYRGSYTKAQRFIAPNPEAGDLDDQIAILVAQEPTTFYCICDPKLMVEWTGEVDELTAGEQRTLTGMTGKSIFLVGRDLAVDGVSYTKHAVIRVDTKDSVTIHNTGTEDEIFVIFYKAE